MPAKGSSTLEIKNVAIKSLALDPANARKHEQKNLESIKGSLAGSGSQARPPLSI